MFYYILLPIIAVILATYLVLRYTVFKNSEKYTKVINITLKVCVVIYCCLMLFNVLMPDAFELSLSQTDLANETVRHGYVIVRWFAMVNFVTLPIAVFYKNRTIRNIAIYFGVIMTFCQLGFYSEYLKDFTSSFGRGFNSIAIMPEGAKQFFINPTFRSVWFGFILALQLLVPLVLAINEKHYFNVCDKKEYLKFFITLPCVIISSLPIYIPQHLFGGYSNLMFTPWSWVHICWLILAIGELIALYFIFRKRDTETKMVLLFVMSLSLLMQYLQMFSAISINAARLPIQLCNIGAFLILLSLMTKNKKIFNFTVIINVVGAIFALAMPDLDGEGLFYLYNMHFIFEHTNVLLVPILALLFGIFPRLDKYALRDCIIGFSIYFVAVWALGTTFNSVYVVTGNEFWKNVNYLFMFKVELDFTQPLFDINFKIGTATFYPVIQLLIYVIFVLVCVLLYFAMRLIYKIKDKIMSKKSISSYQTPSGQIEENISKDVASNDGENNRDEDDEDDQNVGSY